MVIGCLFGEDRKFVFLHCMCLFFFKNFNLARISLDAKIKLASFLVSYVYGNIVDYEISHLPTFVVEIYISRVSQVKPLEESLQCDRFDFSPKFIVHIFLQNVFIGSSEQIWPNAFHFTIIRG